MGQIKWKSGKESMCCDSPCKKAMRWEKEAKEANYYTNSCEQIESKQAKQLSTDGWRANRGKPKEQQTSTQNEF